MWDMHGREESIVSALVEIRGDILQAIDNYDNYSTIHVINNCVIKRLQGIRDSEYIQFLILGSSKQDSIKSPNQCVYIIHVYEIC